MKTLPEILKALVADRYFPVNKTGPKLEAITKAQEAIAKELMGIIGVDEPTSYGKITHDSLREAQNEVRAEVRARLTAFIGHKEER